MRAIVDCNSFYCSCERLFRPVLDQRPVVVLSNNDGCIIARSDEAKQLGIAMGEPYFKARDLIEKNKVATFSSNYYLYGDMSWRVMECMRSLLPPECVEVYSVDEAFLDLSHLPLEQIHSFCIEVKERIEQWTGIRVSIGAAPTKVLSKVANRLCKKNKVATGGVWVLDDAEKITEALRKTAVADIWGIGRQYAEKLRSMGIHTAEDLRAQNTAWARKILGGVIGVRLLQELQGMPCIGMLEELVTKKMIATTRMFGKDVRERSAIREAVATYTSRAAEKLRRQKGAASCIHVFLIPKSPPTTGRFRHGPVIGTYATLPRATDATNDLIKPALQMVDEIFEEGLIYKKAGVMLSGIVPINAVQGSLFDPDDPKKAALMKMIDNVNFSMRGHLLNFAAAGTAGHWKMRQEMRSPRYTTRWEELFLIR
ncbi:MAG: Y-family DNA polymerase [Bacteroidota bacterium]